MPGHCRPCGLWKLSKVWKVPGEGDPASPLILIGEALGEEEERLALPFQGRAGWVLNKAMLLAGLSRSALFITNAVRCRPTNALGKNRTPTAQEIGHCNGWLDDELAALPNKRVLVCLGASAAKAVLGAAMPAGGVLDNQGKVLWSERFRCWVVLTVHPAWLLRKPGELDLLVSDLIAAQRTVELGHPPTSQLATHIEIARTLDDVRRMKHALAGATRWFFDWECLLPEQEVRLAGGSFVRADALRPGDWIVGYDGSQPVTDVVRAVAEGGVQPCVEIQTTYGRRVRVSESHPFLSDGQWIEAGKLKVGTPLTVAAPHGFGSQVKPDEAALLGYIVADFSVGQPHSARVTKHDPTVAARIGDLCQGMGFSLRQAGKNVYDYSASGMQPFLRRHGLFGKVSAQKRVPLEVLSARPDAVAAFLAAHFECDGHVHRFKYELISYTRSERLAFELQDLWWRFGVRAVVWRHAQGAKGVTWWIKVTNRADVQRMLTVLDPLVVDRKQRAAIEALKTRLESHRVERRGSHPRLQKPEAVAKITSLGDQATISIETRKYHNFVVDGLVTHNTTGLHPIRDTGFCVSFAYRPAPEQEPIAFVIPRYRQALFPYWSRHDLPRVDAELREIFLSPVEKGGHNVSFDYQRTRGTLGVWPVNVVTCTMIKHHLPFPHYGERAHGLKRMSQRYLKYGRYDEPLDDWLVAQGHTKDGKPDLGKLWLAPDELVQPYCGTDSVVTCEMDEGLDPVLDREHLTRLFYEEKMPFVLRYAEADFHGVDINAEELTKLDGNLDRAKLATVAQIERLAGHPLNPNSPDQVVKFLYEERGLPIIARTETGKPSTKEEVLKQFEQVEPAAALILHARLYTKYRGSFVETMRSALDADGRIRPNTLHHVVETHRLATRKPFAPHVIPRPLKLWSCPAGHGVYLFDQCCPAAVETTLSIRQVVVPGPGRRFVSGDFTQQEYALAAIISGQQDMEEAMLDRREDAHEWVMQHVGGRSKQEFLVPAVHLYDRNTLARLISEGEVKTPEQLVFKSRGAEADYKNLRSAFKSINFSILYKAGAKNTARALGLKLPDGRPDEGAGQRVIDDYYERLPYIRFWQYQQVMTLRRTGRSANPFGTYRVLPGIYSPDKFDQYEAERQACNAPFQTGGYHVMARAVLRLCAKWQGDPPLRAPFPGRFVLSVHDEILTEARADLVAEAAEDLREAMEQPHPELVGGCGIPRGILSDIKIEDAWGGVYLQVPDAAIIGHGA